MVLFWLHEPFKAESFIQLLPEEEAREIQGLGGI